MDKYDELEFIHQLPLRNFMRTATGYRCSCPICHEGNSPTKRRCNILTSKDFNSVYCFNCGLNTNLKRFIEMVDEGVYQDYTKKEKEIWLQDLQKGTYNKKLKDATRSSDINKNTPLKYQFKLYPKYFRPAIQCREAVEFCKKRQIYDRIEEFYYCINPKAPFFKHLIMPMYMEDGVTMHGFISRHTEHKMFYIHSKNDSFKVYNIFRVDLTKPVYCFEAPIDSMSIDNAIAMCGADLSQKVIDMVPDLTIIFDKDSTGRDKTLKYLNNGYKCFIYPTDFKYKDFNAALQDGMTKQQLEKMVKENIYSGLDGIVRIKFQLMGKR